MGSCKENGCIAWGDERCKSPFYNGGLMLCEVDDRIKSLESERDAARAEVAELKKRLECPAVSRTFSMRTERSLSDATERWST